MCHFFCCLLLLFRRSHYFGVHCGSPMSHATCRTLISMDYGKQCVWLRAQGAQFASSELLCLRWRLLTPCMSSRSMSTVFTPRVFTPCVLSPRVLALHDFAPLVLLACAHSAPSYLHLIQVCLFMMPMRAHICLSQSRKREA
jgi:hypothetical protein